MKWLHLLATLGIGLLACTNVAAQTGPWSGGTLKGQIALSHDGNFNDEDDWGAFPVIIALLDAYGLKDKLVLIDYNNIVQDNDPRFEQEMTASVLGAAQRYGIPAPILHNCRTDLEGAVQAIRDAVNASSAEDPLYYLLAGPMDVPYRGILAADPAKRRHVYCLSHSVWNDGFGTRTIEGRTKRDVISLGINWIQVKPGSGLTCSSRTESTAAQWAQFHWMRDSSDARLPWIYTRLEAEGRCDVSDATITYAFLTGDEDCDPQKLAALLDRKQKPAPAGLRKTIRLEAENFASLENCAPLYGSRQISQRMSVKMEVPKTGAIRTTFREIHAAPSGRYDAGVRYRDQAGGAATFTLLVNGFKQGESWKASRNDDAWTTHTVKDIVIAVDDEIALEVEADGNDRGELDYVQLDYRGLDDPAAMPGQLIVDPAYPHCLKYNGEERCFLFGAGNPEDFFYFGNRQSDGTRAGGQQEAMIKKIAGTGANTFHVLVMRDSRYNLEAGNGAPDANPFVDSDISGKLDEDILRQWEGWLDQLEAAGVNVLFNFYNDFDDYEDKAGWRLDADGNLHPQEKYLITTLVERFKHHKNIIWALEESCNKLSRARQQRLMKVAELIAGVDDFHHPIAAMFQILYYDEVHPDGVGPEDYVGDPHVGIMTWGHYSSPAKGLPNVEQYYKELVGHFNESAGRYVLINTEVDKHPYAGQANRLYCWTSAMANMYTSMSSHRPDKKYVTRETFMDDGRIRRFMENTDFYRMSPRNDFKLGSTRYVLASESGTCIAYSPDAAEKMGVRKMEAGTYLLRWFDTSTGTTVEQVVPVSAGDHSWPRPAGIGKEAALYVRRLPGVVAGESN